MEILERIENVIKTRDEKIKTLKAEVEEMEVQLSEKKEKVKELKNNFAKTLEVSIADEISVEEVEIMKLASKINTIRGNMDMTPIVDVTVEEAREQFEAELEASGLKKAMDDVIKAQGQYFAKLEKYRDIVKGLYDLKYSLKRKKEYLNEEVYYDIAGEMAKLHIRTAFKPIGKNGTCRDMTDVGRKEDKLFSEIRCYSDVITSGQ